MRKKLSVYFVMILCIFNLFSCSKDKYEPVTEDEQVEDIETEDDEEETNEPTKSIIKVEMEETEPASEVKPSEEVKKDEPSLKSYLMRIASVKEDEVVMFDQRDFDNDGSQEAFAIIGEIVEDYGDKKVASGSIWFISKDGCRKIKETNALGFFDKDRIMKMGDTDYILFDEVYVTALVTDAWYVSDGMPVETPFSAKGEIVIDQNKKDRFEIVDDCYDAEYYPADDHWLGHTWKKYYFFYNDEDGKIYEYGGTDISDETAEYWCGFDIVDKYLPKGDQVDSLFCRGNGLVVLNYEHKEGDSITYYHYIYDFTKESLVDEMGEITGEEPLWGIYLEALCPEIANYPEVPGPNM